MALKSVEWFIASRYLKLSRKQGVVAVIAGFSFLGILLGVATLIIVMSVMNGFRHELVSRVIGFNGHITVSQFSGKLQNADEVVQKIRSLKGVTSCAPYVERQVLLTAKNGAAGALVRGIAQSDLFHRPLIAKNIVGGSLENFGAPATILIGHKLAQKLQVSVGDKIKILSPESQPTLLGSLPKSRHFKVTAVFDSGMHEYDSAFIFIPLKDSQAFFSMEQTVSGIEVFVPNPEDLSSLKTTLLHLFPELSVYDWQQANQKFFSTIEVQRNVMFLILMLIIVVAAFNIISCLIMIVKDKTKDIAVMRTLGASRQSILKIFFLTGASLGVAGTLGGTALGLLFSYNIDHIRRFLESLSGTNLFRAEIYFLSHLPSRTDVSEVAVVVVTALFLSFLATFYPAYQACRIQPAEGLRYE